MRPLNTFVNKLLEYEARARRMADEARAHYERTIDAVASEKESLRADANARADRHIAEAAAAAQAEAEAEIREIERLCGERADAIERSWRENATAWREELLARCKRGG